MKNLDPMTEIARNSEIIATELDDEVVMMSIEQGEYYGLGDVGSQIWRILVEPTSVKTIIEHFVEQYEVSYDQCQDDINVFLVQLQQKGLIAFTQTNSV